MDILKDIEDIKTWCESIIETQKEVIYTALTSPKDINHIVKEYVSKIMAYLKSIGTNDISSITNLKYKEALKIFLAFLSTNQVWKPSKNKLLKDDELEAAFKDLYVDAYVKCDRKFNDVANRNQNYGIFSFQPTLNALPDESGIYGFIKLRGAFNRLEEAEETSKELIQYHSANQIFVCELGSPVPLQIRLENKDYVTEVDNPNQSEYTTKYSDLIKEQTKQEKHEIEEIKNRVENLKADVEKDPKDKDPMQRYLELHQKRATASYLYTEHKKKLQEMKDTIIVARKCIVEMDETHPNFKGEYIDHYKKTSEKCGIDKATDNMAIMIRDFIGNDPELW